MSEDKNVETTSTEEQAAKPHVQLTVQEVNGQMEINLSRTADVGTQEEQMYIKMIADSLNGSLEVILPPENVGYAMIRIEKQGDQVGISKAAVCGAGEGEFRKSIERCTNSLFKILTNSKKKKRWGLF
jgi:hypothetical protein